MFKHRITSTVAVAFAAVAAAAPTSQAGQPSLSAAVHLEAHANADTSAAKNAARSSGLRNAQTTATNSTDTATTRMIKKLARIFDVLRRVRWMEP